MKQTLLKVLTRRSFLILSALALSGGVSQANAQDARFPERPITIVVPGPAGGVADVITRVMGQEMAKILGQPIIVDNKPGASQIIGVQAVARAQPDGYTILMGPSTAIVVSPQLNKVPYDPQRDLTPIGFVGQAETLIVTNPASGFKSLEDLIAFARANPGKLNFGSAGQGTVYHLGIEHLQSLAQIKMNHVPYKGSVQAEIGLVAGEVDVIVTNTTSILPHLQSGRAIALAVLSRGASKTLPQVPAASQTVPGYVLDTWLGLYAPAGTPKEILEKLNEATAVTFKNAEVVESIRGKGFEPNPGTVEDLVRFQDQERTVWKQVIDAAKARGSL